MPFEAPKGGTQVLALERQALLHHHIIGNTAVECADRFARLSQRFENQADRRRRIASPGDFRPDDPTVAFAADGRTATAHRLDDGHFAHERSMDSHAPHPRHIVNRPRRAQVRNQR